MNDKITLAQFMEQAENWVHSNEYFEQCRTAAEIDVADQFLESQEFALEAADTGMTFTEGFLMESADENKLQVIKEANEEKKKGLFAAIGRGLKRIFAAIAKVFQAIANLLTGKATNSKQIRNKVEKLVAKGKTLSPEAQQKLISDTNQKETKISKLQTIIKVNKVPKDLMHNAIKFFGDAMSNESAQLYILLSMTADGEISLNGDVDVLTVKETGDFYTKWIAAANSQGREKSYQSLLKALKGHTAKTIVLNSNELKTVAGRLNENLTDFAVDSKANKDSQTIVDANAEMTNKFAKTSKFYSAIGTIKNESVDLIASYVNSVK